MLSNSLPVHESSGLGKSSDGLSSISFDKLFQQLLLFFFLFLFYFFFPATHFKDNLILQISQKQLRRQ